MKQTDKSSKKLPVKQIIFFIVFVLSLFLNIFLINEKYQQTKVISITDGDSFVLKTGERIRLLGVNAPEKDVCLGQEAKDLLTHELLNKNVWLEEKTRDDYGRTLAVAFVSSPVILPFPDFSQMRVVSVNEKLALAGLASHTSSAGKYKDAINLAVRNAKDQHLGIYSDKCQSKISPNPKCTIKGNIDQSSGQKFYHFPICLHYNETIINEALGEKWICTEDEAIKSGFKKAEGC